jgi:hypothetical protein
MKNGTVQVLMGYTGRTSTGMWKQATTAAKDPTGLCLNYLTSLNTFNKSDIMSNCCLGRHDFAKHDDNRNSFIITCINSYTHLEQMAGELELKSNAYYIRWKKRGYKRMYESKRLKMSRKGKIYVFLLLSLEMNFNYFRRHDRRVTVSFIT